MPMTPTADKYLQAFRDSEDMPGGLAFKQMLTWIRLDHSLDSLKRIDTLLDQIRDRYQPEHRAFLSEQANQNFLYLLAFYVGKTVSLRGGSAIEWLAYDELIENEPQLASVWPRQFETSVVCSLTKPAGGLKQFLPLVPIVIRLFEGPEEKSVWFSATGFI